MVGEWTRGAQSCVRNAFPGPEPINGHLAKPRNAPYVKGSASLHLHQKIIIAALTSTLIG